MGLYDGYRLSNSTNIPKYQGMPLAELQKFLEIKQGLYDQGLALDEGITDIAGKIRALPRSAAALNQLNEETFAEKDNIAKSGDYENMVPQLAKVARRYKQQVGAFAEEYAKYQDWYGDLQKNDKINATTRQLYVQEALMEHKGVRMNPTTGRYESTFQAPLIQKDIDLTEFVKKAVGDIAAREVGTDYKYEIKDGEAWIRSAKKSVKVTPDMISRALQAATNDPEFQSWVDREKRHRTLGVDYLPADSFSPKDQVNIRAIMAKTGLSFNKSARLLKQDQVGGMISQDLNALASKYIKDNVETTNHSGSTEWGTHLRKKELEDKEGQYFLAYPGQAMPFKAPFTSSSEYQKVNSDNEKMIKDSELKIHSIKPGINRYNVRDYMDTPEFQKLPKESQVAIKNEADKLTAASREIDRNSRVMRGLYSEAMANTPGFKTPDVATIEKYFGKNQKDPVTGKVYSAEEVFNRWMMNYMSNLPSERKAVSMGTYGSYISTGKNTDALPLTFKTDDGRNLKMPDSFAPKIEAFLKEAYGGKQHFVDGLRGLESKVAEKLKSPVQITDQLVKLDDKTSKILSESFAAGNANINVVGVDGQPIDLKRYKNVQVTEVSPRSFAGRPYYTVTMDKTNEEGKVTEAGVKGYFEFPGSNIDQYVGARMSKSTNPDAQRVGAQLMVGKQLGTEGLSTWLRTSPQGTYNLDNIEPGLAIRKKGHSYADGTSGQPILELTKNGVPVPGTKPIVTLDEGDLEDHIVRYLINKQAEKK